MYKKGSKIEYSMIQLGHLVRIKLKNGPVRLPMLRTTHKIRKNLDYSKSLNEITNCKYVYNSELLYPFRPSRLVK